jgi:predicted deacetylase
MEITRHTCNNGDGPHFGRLDPEHCPRCAELAAGAPRRTLPWVEAVKRNQAADEARRVHMAEHFASARHNDRTHPQWCGPVCTAFDW